MATGLERALKTVDIKGKAYVTVNERIKYFREHFTGYRLITDIVYHNQAEYLTWDDNGETKGAWKSAEICFKASILNEKGELVATGYAMEKADSSYINITWPRWMGPFVAPPLGEELEGAIGGMVGRGFGWH